MSDNVTIYIYVISHLFVMELDITTGCAKSNVPNVEAYSAAQNCQIPKFFSGTSRYFHSFEEYVKSKEIEAHFFE